MNELLINESDANWEHIAPHLDAALGELSEPDRDALMSRYFERKSAREMALTLGISDEAAQKRVNRAVERLREFFAKRGVTVGASGLAVFISANAVQAAPVGLGMSIVTAAAAFGGGVAQTSTALAATQTIVMNTLQKTLIAATITVAVGTGFYQARQASALRSQVETLQQQGTNQVQQVKQERDAAMDRFATSQAENDRLRQEAAEILRLRAEVARLRSEAEQMTLLKPGAATDPTESAARTWVNRVAQLRQHLALVPEARIPEMQLLDEEDWLAAVKGRPLETDADYRRAMSTLRSAGEDKLATKMQKALRGFAPNHNGEFPIELVQLQRYFDSPVDAAMLDRWAIQPGDTVPSVGVGEFIITQKAPVDEVFDTRHVVGSAGGRGSTDFLPRETWDALKPVYKSYRAAHNGQSHSELSELQPHVTTPEQQVALQKVILRNSAAR